MYGGKCGAVPNECTSLFYYQQSDVTTQPMHTSDADYIKPQLVLGKSIVAGKTLIVTSGHLAYPS